jgi:hypothetical protein
LPQDIEGIVTERVPWARYKITILGGIMVWFRKVLILSHRYLGIVLSVMFVMWFVTGIGMICGPGESL